MPPALMVPVALYRRTSPPTTLVTYGVLHTGAGGVRVATGSACGKLFTLVWVLVPNPEDISWLVHTFSVSDELKRSKSLVVFSE